VAVQVITTTPAFSGNNPPDPTSNPFAFPAAANPFKQQAATGGWYVEGDSDGSVGTAGFRTSVKDAAGLNVAWTPSLSNTSPNYGTGAIRTGFYVRNGDWVMGNFTIVLGSGSNFNTFGALTFNLPTAVKSGENWDDSGVGSALLFDTSVGTRWGRTAAIWTLAGGTGGVGEMRLYRADGTGGASTGIDPFGGAAGDTYKGSFAYRAA
jgi:hypothetical protein